MRPIALHGMLVACAALTGCTLPQWYAAGQHWQRGQCQKLEDRDERTRCEQGVAMSFERYKAQAGASARP
jgi:hypothetical protein